MGRRFKENCGLKIRNVFKCSGTTRSHRDHYTNHQTWGCFVARDIDTLDNEIMKKEDDHQILQHDLKSTARWLKMGLG